jgi:aspartyl/asparaginyl beta-hydroxylase (cupin superfamily)
VDARRHATPGRIKEHRDFSGGVPMGVARFHVPIVTHPDVEFYVSGRRVVMDPGSVWSLDTSYPHRVANRSNVSRVHLILDVDLDDAVVAMLPPRTWRDRIHSAHFAGLCVAKGASLVLRDPRALGRRIANFVRLRFLGQSIVTEPRG